MKPKSDNIGATNTLAMLSLILGLLFFVIGPFGSLPGLICGLIALFQFHKYGIKCGRGIAISGSIVSLIGLVFSALFISIFIQLVSSDSSFLQTIFEMLQEASKLEEQTY